MPPSTLLYSHLLHSSTFISTSLIAPALHGKHTWVNVMCAVRAQHLLFLVCQKLGIYLLPHGVNRTLPPPTLLNQDSSSCLSTVCDSNFFHLKKLQEKKNFIPIYQKFKTNKQIERTQSQTTPPKPPNKQSLQTTQTNQQNYTNTQTKPNPNKI